MKKVTLDALLKSARKSAKKSLTSKFLTIIQSTIAEQNQDAERLNKKMEKVSRSLAKKVTRKFKYSKEELIDMNNEIEVTPIKGPSETRSNEQRPSIANRKTRIKHTDQFTEPTTRPK